MYGTYDSVFDFHVVFRELRERFLQYIFNLSILRGLLIIEKKAKIKKLHQKVSLAMQHGLRWRSSSRHWRARGRKSQTADTGYCRLLVQ